MQLQLTGPACRKQLAGYQNGEPESQWPGTQHACTLTQSGNHHRRRPGPGAHASGQLLLGGWQGGWPAGGGWRWWPDGVGRAPDGQRCVTWWRWTWDCHQKQPVGKQQWLQGSWEAAAAPVAGEAALGRCCWYRPCWCPLGLWGSQGSLASCLSSLHRHHRLLPCRSQCWACCQAWSQQPGM